MSCMKGRMKTKVLSKLNCTRPSKKGEQKDATKKKKTETKPQQEMNAHSSKNEELENYQAHTAQGTIEPQIGVSLNEVTVEEEQDEIGSLKNSESKAEISRSAAPLRRPSTVERIRNFLKPKSRRDAICDEMERNVDNSGLSLRQYRKFLATTSVLQELKML